MWGRSGRAGFFSYFPLLKSRCVLWSGASYSPKNMVFTEPVLGRDGPTPTPHLPGLLWQGGTGGPGQEAVFCPWHSFASLFPDHRGCPCLHTSSPLPKGQVTKFPGPPVLHTQISTPCSFDVILVSAQREPGTLDLASQSLLPGLRTLKCPHLSVYRSE